MKKKLATLLTMSVCLVGYFVMTAWADDREIDALREKAAGMLRDAKEHAARGHADEALELERFAQALRAEAEEMAEHRERREHEERERHEQRDERNVDGHEQIEHIRQAAVHLQFAGMQEQAEDLMRQAEQRQHELERDREGHHDEGLQRRVEELTKHVHELHERLERMERAVRELSDRGNPRPPSDAP